ncbi:NAD(P)-dependent alcohol dehydrogenase [Xenorhabdus sp. TH1]|uniref:zinc-dependent alcohol dehydrogenase family protein n=1 Tax=Xenorhabdus sp. TH1 TaxID=3130166 RepID=UPI0030D5B143
MKQYQLKIHKDKYIPVMVDAKLPELEPSEIRIAMDAWSINYRDLLISAFNSDISREGLVPLSDGSGIIVEVGTNVSRLKVGQRVCPIFFHDWRTGSFKETDIQSALGGSFPGVLSEQIVIDEKSVVVIPEQFSAIEASTLPCAAVTAWQALFVRGNLNENSTVLIQGTGGVALFALQFAKAVGAKVIITSSSDQKLQFAQKLGADVLINYQKIPEWDKEVKIATEGVGATHILELGGPDTFSLSLNCLSAGGYILQIGVLTGFGAQTNLMRLQSINATICGISVGSRVHFENMIDFMIRHNIKPIIDMIFPFTEATKAYSYIASAKHTGKICITHE